MYRQWYNFRTAKAMTYNDTYREDLPKSGFLSAIWLYVYGAGVTDSMNALEKWRVVDYISNIKIVPTGGEAIKNFTGRCLQALLIDQGYPATTVQEFNYGSSTKRLRLPICFGRYPGDQLYGLDLGRFDNVEIQVANDATASQFASGFSVSLVLEFLRDLPGGNPFTSYFRTEEYRKITTVAAKHDYVDLQTTGKLRRLLLQVDPTVDSAENAQRSLYSTLSNVKMTFRDGSDDFIDCNPRELWDRAYMFGRDVVVTGAEPYHTSLEGIRTGLGQTLYKASVAMPQGMASATPTIALEAGNDSSTQKILKTGTDSASMILIGHGPENTFCIPFDHPENTEEMYLDLEAKKTVQLDLLTGSDANDTSATYRIVTDRLVNM